MNSSRLRAFSQACGATPRSITERGPACSGLPKHTLTQRQRAAWP
jgi:hypothetical protein